MKPYFERAGITLYHSPAEDILPLLCPESVDLLLTDPPYGISYRSTSTRESLAKSIADDDDLNALRGTLPLIDRLLSPNRHCYIFAAPMRIGEAIDAVAEYWNVKNPIVWDKGNAGSRGDLSAGYANNWEAIVYANKGRRPLFGPRPRAIFRYDWQGSRDPIHPTVKPVGLFRAILAKSSAPAELVLDPFCGSGPVLQAAAEMGRRAIGVEIDERHCETTATRVEKILEALPV